MRSQIAAGVCLSCALSVAVVLGTYAKPPLATQQEPNGKSPETNEGVPEHVFYEQLFSLLVALNNSDDYQKQAALTDVQRSSLERTAKECQREIAAQDAKAQITIRALREKRTNQKPPDSFLPPPPPEIAELQRERDAIVLRHRDRLREALGEDAFRRVTEGAKTIVQISVESASPTH